MAKTLGVEWQKKFRGFGKLSLAGWVLIIEDNTLCPHRPDLNKGPTLNKGLNLL